MRIQSIKVLGCWSPCPGELSANVDHMRTLPHFKIRRYYGTDPVAVLDFASLYPSIMRAHNLSPDTFVRPSDVARFRALGVPMTEIDVKDTQRVGRERENFLFDYPSIKQCSVSLHFTAYKGYLSHIHIQICST